MTRAGAGTPRKRLAPRSHAHRSISAPAQSYGLAQRCALKILRASMDSFVFAAVLFAAACHAGWNATIKRTLDPLATTVLISIGAALVSLLLVPLTGLPE